MKKNVVGKEKVDYFSKKNNKQVTGLKLHVVGNDDRVEGMSCDSIYVSSASPIYADVCSIAIGSDIEVSYNRWGTVDTIALCKR